MLTPSEITEAQRLCDTATPEPWDYDEIMTPFYNDPDGHSRGGLGAGFWEVFADDPSEPDGDPIMLVDRATKANAAFFARARTLLPKALAHITEQDAALRQAQAEGALLREALHKWVDVGPDALIIVEAGCGHEMGWPPDDGNPPELCVECETERALSSTVRTSAYAARVARLEKFVTDVRQCMECESIQDALDGIGEALSLLAEGDG